MNFFAIFIGIAILALAIPYVLNPLINERKKKPVKAVPQKLDGQGQHKDTLAAIRDLDFDFQTGKVTQEDYEALRSQLAFEAAEYLQVKQQEDEKIEAMIRAHLQAVKSSARCEKCGGELRPEDQFCPACGIPAKSQGGSEEPAVQLTCPVCRKKFREGDLFCTGCGTRLNGQPSLETDSAKI